MPQRAATIESLPMAFEFVKAMRDDELEWGEGYRALGRQAWAKVIKEQRGVEGRAARYPHTRAPAEPAESQNGNSRPLRLTPLADLGLCLPRPRPFSPT